jgi:hypothetical protein
MLPVVNSCAIAADAITRKGRKDFRDGLGLMGASCANGIEKR